jgi:predicted nucleotidyltransferase
MGKKQLPEEFKDFIRCLNLYNVKYLLVGGWAVGIYGHPRATKDIDFLVSNDEKNLKKLQNAFLKFGSPPIDIEAFKVEGYVIRIGSSPTQIDVINKASGININDCFQRKNIIDIDGIRIMLISKEDLIINKKASGRQTDLGDVEKLTFDKRLTVNNISKSNNGGGRK